MKTIEKNTKYLDIGTKICFPYGEIPNLEIISQGPIYFGYQKPDGTFECMKHRNVYVAYTTFGDFKPGEIVETSIDFQYKILWQGENRTFVRVLNRSSMDNEKLMQKFIPCKRVEE